MSVNNLFDIVFAICPNCGAECHGEDKKSALKSYKKHRCTATLTGRQITNILKKVINKER